MASGNNNNIIGTYIIGDDNQLEQELRMASANGSSSTSTYIAWDDDQQ